MKTILSNFVLTLWASVAFAQANLGKYDNSWVFGNFNSSVNTVLTFQQNDLTFLRSFPKILPMDFSNSCMSNADGELMFFTNGVSLATSKGNYLKNGKYINPEVSKSPWFNYGIPSPQQTLILPAPGLDNKYFVFHTEFANKDIGGILTVYAPKIYFTLVDMSENAGDGNVIDLNHELIADTLAATQLSACKHANGRDYWVFVQKLSSNLFYRILLTSQGVFVEGLQACGDFITAPAGQSLFSPDGTKMMRSFASELGKPCYLDLFDFDRCTGLLSNPKRIVVQDSLVGAVFGGAISPNSRYAYVTNFKYVYQYDLWSADIVASKDTVALYDNFTTPTGALTTFFLAQLGPNGKIYIMGGPNASEYLHIIDKPDEKGKACNVLQHSLQMPVGSGWTIPNFPNYRLGPLKGSPCDSISVATKELSPSDYGLKIFPNPATEQIHIDITLPNYDQSTKTELVIVDIGGEIVKKYPMPDFAYLASLDISKLASGVYGVQLRQRNRVMAVEKLVVVR